MEFITFAVCVVVFGFFIITTDFKQKKMANIFFVILCLAIIIIMGLIVLYDQTYPVPSENNFAQAFSQTM